MHGKRSRRALVVLASLLVVMLAAGPVSALTAETEVTVGATTPSSPRTSRTSRRWP
jgi:hypothetical protein